MVCAASALAANNVRGWRDTAGPLTDSPHCSAALPPGAVSNKINYQVAAQRTGRSIGRVSLYRLRCVDAAALINQLHKPALTNCSLRKFTFVVPILQDEAAAQRRSRTPCTFVPSASA